MNPSVGSRLAAEIHARHELAARYLGEVDATGLLIIRDVDRETIGALGAYPEAEARTVIEQIGSLWLATDTVLLGTGKPVQLEVRAAPRDASAEEIEAVQRDGKAVLPLRERL